VPADRDPLRGERLARAIDADPLRERELGGAGEQVHLHLELARDGRGGRAREMAELEVRRRRPCVVAPARVALRRARVLDLCERQRRPPPAWFFAGPTGSLAGSIAIVQWQCGWRSFGTRGGRCRGRTRARGFVA
jgi:hypothetical protein